MSKDNNTTKVQASLAEMSVKDAIEWDIGQVILSGTVMVDPMPMPHTPLVVAAKLVGGTKKVINSILKKEIEK